MQTLEIKAAIQVLKPVHEVYEAIVDPAKMCNYFISESTGRMEAGKTLNWRFPEYDMDVPVRVEKTEKDSLISFYWSNAESEQLVELHLSTSKQGTLVRVTEKSMPNNEAGIKWLMGNTEGWANFLACLKAYAEYGINLRKGAFDYRND